MLSAVPTVLRIGSCAFADARPLLAQHYAIGMPARVCCTLGAWIESDLVGVLTVSHPTLNDRWRALAWPGVFDSRDKRERARLLNEQVRRISRVVVRPRFRGMGIATSLVRAYLRRPLTSKTEVVAAMGEFCSCFEQAGMRAIECSPIERDVKLATALKRMRIAPELLADEHVVQVLSRDAAFVKAIRAWANASGATRKFLDITDDIERSETPSVIAPPGLRDDTSPFGKGGGLKRGARQRYVHAEGIEVLAPMAARAVMAGPPRVWADELRISDCGLRIAEWEERGTRSSECGAGGRRDRKRGLPQSRRERGGCRDG